MLNKQSAYVPFSRKLVNIASASCVLLAIAFSATQAQANEEEGKVVTIKFTKSELTNPGGVETVYDKFIRKARSECRGGPSINSVFRSHVRSCTADLVDQFVVSSDIDVLTEWHLTETKTFTPMKLTKVME